MAVEAVRGNHEADPDLDTIRGRTGRPDGLLDSSEYPLQATCRVCRGGAMLRHWLGDWEHDRPEIPVPRGARHE